MQVIVEESNMQNMSPPVLRTALQAVTDIHAALQAAGLERTSRYNGGEIVGWTESLGSTGFSVREMEDGKVSWHVVISGKPHLSYRTYRDGEDELHEPVDPERLCPRIGAVLKSIGLDVDKVSYGGHQTMWDDDVEYDVVTARPAWLEARPTPAPRPSRWF